jgi:hypothetical protein
VRSLRSDVQLADEEQRKLPPILLKLTPLALAFAGLPPLTETEALLASYSQVTPPQTNFPPAFFTLSVPLPPLPVISAAQGVFSDEAVQEIVTNPDVITDLVPATSCVLIDVPLP